jgi:oligoendopeptidase F
MKPTLEEIEILTQITDFEKNLEETDLKLFNEEWKTYFNIENRDLLKSLRERRLSIFNDPENFRKLKLLHGKYSSSDKVSDRAKQILSRWHEELSREIMPTESLQNQALSLSEFEDKLVKTRGSFQMTIKSDGDSARKINFEETHNILRTNTDRSLRQEVFTNRARLGNDLLHGGFRDLILKRNEFARAFAKELGYKDHEKTNFYSLRLKQLDFDEEEIFEIFKLLKEKSDDITFRILEKTKILHGWQKVEPWDIPMAVYSDNSDLDKYFPKEVLNDNVVKVAKGMGFDVDGYSLTFDLYPKEGKFDNAMCFTINPPKYDGSVKIKKGDIRLFANLMHGGLREQKTIFHEWGHLLHSAESKQEFYLFRTMPNNPSLTEGIAMFSEYLPLEEDFFTKILSGKTSDSRELSKAQELRKAYEKKELRTAILEMRLILSRVFFERELYKNPDADYAKIWSEIYSDFMFATRQDNVHAWVERPHFLSHAVYYQSYAIAALLKEQFFNNFKNRFKSLIDNPKLGDHLKKTCFWPANSKKWDQIVKDMVGEGLNPKPFLDKIAKIDND